MTILRQWAESELKLARSKLNDPIESMGQRLMNASLSGRISALTEMLHQMNVRAS